MRRWAKLPAGLALAAALLRCLGAQPAPPAGKAVFERRCAGCHAADRNMEGPRLRGVYGRRAGALSEFGYSEGLRKLGWKWDDASLELWLKDPEAVAPDTDMSFRVPDAAERKAVIGFLRGLGQAAGPRDRTAN